MINTLAEVLEYLGSQMLFSDLRASYARILVDDELEDDLILLIENTQQDYLYFLSRSRRSLVYRIVKATGEYFSEEVALSSIMDSDSRISGFKCHVDLLDFLFGTHEKSEKPESISENIVWRIAHRLAKNGLEKSPQIFTFVWEDEAKAVYFRLHEEMSARFALFHNGLLIDKEACEKIENHLAGKYCTFSTLISHPVEEEDELPVEEKNESPIEERLKTGTDHSSLKFLFDSIKEKIENHESILTWLEEFFENQEYLKDNVIFEARVLVEQFSTLTDLSEMLYRDFPSNLSNFHLLVCLYRSQENSDDEIRILNETLDRFPKQTEIYTILARSYDRMQLSEPALRILERALDIEDVDRLSILKQILELHEKHQRHTEQLSILDEISNIAQTEQDNEMLFMVDYNRARALVNIGRDTEAINYFERAIGLSPKDIAPYRELARTAERSVNLQSATEVLERALANTEKHGEIYDLMGELYMRNQSYEKAIDCYEKARGLSPKNTEFLFKLGTIYMRLDEKDKARKCLEELLDNEPGHVAARNSLRTLQPETSTRSADRIEIKGNIDIQDICALLPSDIQDRLPESKNASFNRSKYSKLLFRSFQSGIGFTARVSCFYETVEYSYNTGFTEGLLISAINLCAAKSLELRRIHNDLTKSLEYDIATFRLLRYCDDLPKNMESLMIYDIDYYIGNLGKYRDCLSDAVYIIVLLLYKQPDEKSQLFRELLNGKYENIIRRTFVDISIELYNSGEKGHIMDWCEMDWPSSIRESLAALLLSSKVHMQPEDRRELLKSLFGFMGKIDSRKIGTIGLLSGLGDVFYDYCQENISAQNKASYHGKILRDRIDIPKHISKTYGRRPEGGIFNRTFNILSKEIDRETEKVILFPELDIHTSTESIPLVEETAISYRITNTGSGPANNVTLSISISDGLEVLAKEQKLGIISGNQEISEEINVRPLREGEFPVEFILQYTNLEGKANEKRLSEVISIYSVSDFRAILSPYIPGLPIKTSDMFYGRQDTMDMIMNKLRGVYQDNVLILHGQRRTGKTSILYQLRDHYIKEPYVPVFVDMQKLRSAQTGRLCRKIAELTLDELEKKRIKTSASLEEPWLQRFEQEPIGALDDFFDDLAKNSPNQKILILFDEFEGLINSVLEEKVSRDFLDVMRSWMQHSKNIEFIITGADKLREMMETYSSPLFQIAEFITIDYLKPNDARDLIIRPVLDKLDYEDSAVSKIVKLTAGNPYYIQLICQKIVERMNYAKRKKVTIIDVDKVVLESLVTEGIYFDHLWEQSDAKEKLFIACLADLSNSYDEWVSCENVLNTMRRHEMVLQDEGTVLMTSQNLRNRGVIDQRDIEGEAEFRIRVDLFRLRCRSYQPLSQVLKEVHANE